jgi:methylmalonyl-CoA mutase cobalamin-binding subunit
MSAMICASHGCKVHYLGADLPPLEVARYARAAGAAIVAISVVLLDGLPELPAQLAAIRAELGPEVPVWVGGQGAHGLDQAALPANCVVIADRAELEQRLDVLPR